MDLATGALGSLLPKLVQLLANEYNRLKGLRKDVEFLERELRSMHAALRKLAEVPRDQLDKQVRLWANEVRELSYNMEDVVDRFPVCVEGPDNTVESSHKLKRLMKKMAELFTKGKTSHQIADTIKDIKGQVEDVAACWDRYRIDDIVANPIATATVDPRLLALYKDQKDLVGIQEASVDLINRLAVGNGDDASMQHLNILSIVGVGGLGKTTLAKAVYDGMKEEFDCKAFVSVGRNPDLKKIVKNILYELDKGKYMSLNEAMFVERQLIDELRDLLQNKRYFIIIDDIWDTPTWEIVKCAFVDSNRGSRIVTTTRIFKVATTANDVYKMKPLSDENSKELFCKRLFGGKYKNPYNQPSELFEKILRKCGGGPLAIITIANGTDDIPVVMGGDAFPRLRSCWMNAPCRFLPGAMPSLERIRFQVHVRALKEANFDFDFGSLENLPCLRDVIVDTIYCNNTTATEMDEVEAAVRRVVDIHPNHPILRLGLL